MRPGVRGAITLLRNIGLFFVVFLPATTRLVMTAS
jgi:hypothetical protein